VLALEQVQALALGLAKGQASEQALASELVLASEQALALGLAQGQASEQALALE